MMMDSMIEYELMVFLSIAIIAIILLPMIFFLLHLQKLLTRCKTADKMTPGLVWLNLIPLFNFGWIFYTVSCVRDSLKIEFKSRVLETDDPQFGYSIGLAYCITWVCSIVPVVGFFSSIASIILFIIYWVKTHKYSSQLD